MKKSLKIHKSIINLSLISFLLFFAISITQSCSNSSDIELENASFTKSLLKTDLKKLKKTHKNSKYINKVILNSLNYKFNDNQYFQEIVNSNLNSNFNSSNLINITIDAIAVYTDNFENVKGLGVYYYNSNSKELLFYLMKNKNNNFVEVAGFPKTTLHIISDDIMYLANKFFEFSNINMIYNSDDLEYDELEKSYNDLGLYKTLNTLNYYKNNLVIPDDDLIGGGDGCGLTHACVNGTPGYACVPAGCKRICQKNEAFQAVKDFENNDSIDLMLTDNKLYAFRNLLNSSDKGTIYVDLYYKVIRHFYSSINTSVILKIIPQKNNLSAILDKIEDVNYQGIILDDTSENILNELLISSKNSSDSDEYKKAIDVIISEMSEYVNLTKSEFINKLNE